MFKLNLFCFALYAIFTTSSQASTSDKASLGQTLFFDTRLSINNAQSCATCHNPQHAFIDNRENSRFRMVSEGADGQSFGNRNTPTAMYGAFHQTFSYDEKRQTYKGGVFWDGRAADLAAQAGQPPLNPVEMQMPSKEALVQRLSTIDFYQESFKKIYGADIWNNTDKAYQAMEDAIASFEKTKEFAPFDSKYDRYLRGEYELSPLEDLGRTLFFSNNNVNCKTCHSLKAEDSPEELFTNFEYHNIGVPRNLKLMVLNQLNDHFRDQGLLDNPLVSGDTKQAGKFKTPTLRNVAVTGPYMHNGVFKDLRTVILFYDKFNNPERTLNPETGEPWGEPEVAETVNLTDLKANALSDRKVDALVAFLKTLTDARYEHLLDK